MAATKIRTVILDTVAASEMSENSTKNVAQISCSKIALAFQFIVGIQFISQHPELLEEVVAFGIDNLEC